MFYQGVKKKIRNWLTSIIKKILLYLGHYLPFFSELVFHILSFLEMFCPRFCDNLYTTAYQVDRRAFSFLQRQTLCIISPALELCSWLPNAQKADKSKHCFVLLIDASEIHIRNFRNQPLLLGPFLHLSATNLPLQMYLSRVLPLMQQIFWLGIFPLQNAKDSTAAKNKYLTRFMFSLSRATSA